MNYPINAKNGFHVHAANDTVGTTPELVCRVPASAYAQLAAEDYLEVVSAQAADTSQVITIWGIGTDGNRQHCNVSLNGATAVTSGVKFRYFENAVLDKECTGAVTIRRATGDTFICSIPVGSLYTEIAQHFCGQYDVYITLFAAGLEDIDNDCLTELRWYPDDADCLDAGDGYMVLDRIPLYATEGPNPPARNYVHPIRCKAGGWICVYADGAADSANLSVTIQGYSEVAI